MKFICALLIVAFPVLSISYNPGPPEDGLDWIDNSLVPGPSKIGGRLIYTPTRKDPLLVQSYKQKLKRAQVVKSAEKVGEDLRLPKDVLPYRYSIQLLPFIEEGNFTTDGYIMIFVNCTQATRNISMNSFNIAFYENSITVN